MPNEPVLSSPRLTLLHASFELQHESGILLAILGKLTKNDLILFACIADPEFYYLLAYLKFIVPPRDSSGGVDETAFRLRTNCWTWLHHTSYLSHSQKQSL